MLVVDQATALFNRCVASHAFREGEYDRFKLVLQQVTIRASEVALRAPLDVDGDLRREYLEWGLFIWDSLRDTIKCFREAQRLMLDLEGSSPDFGAKSGDYF
ncbi:hypothetical protein L218DRAFT_1008450 [Marasmius fiardii PR-910]|nr:hypothetical protein L218DRAFT_1008450 [Marasmius fiardii PR-910]